MTEPPRVRPVPGEADRRPRIAIFADIGTIEAASNSARHPAVSGFTTNPSLLKKGGVTDYRAFARELVELAVDRPVSLEVLDDDPETVERQADELSSWGANVFVKVPALNRRGESMAPTVRRVAARGTNVNATAIFTLAQLEEMADAVCEAPLAFVSMFAGRIADTGRDPVPIVRAAAQHVASLPAVSLMWASTREVLNVRQAADAGCAAITLTPDVLAKLALADRPLWELSLETVRAFYDDARSAKLAVGEPSAR